MLLAYLDLLSRVSSIRQILTVIPDFLHSPQSHQQTLCGQSGVDWYETLSIQIYY